MICTLQGTSAAHVGSLVNEWRRAEKKRRKSESADRDQLPSHVSLLFLFFLILLNQTQCFLPWLNQPTRQPSDFRITLILTFFYIHSEPSFTPFWKKSHNLKQRKRNFSKNYFLVLWPCGSRSFYDGVRRLDQDVHNSSVCYFHPCRSVTQWHKMSHNCPTRTGCQSYFSWFLLLAGTG